jgi:hypothetical protein
MEMWWRDSGDWASKVIQGGVIRMFKYANDQVVQFDNRRSRE